MNGNYIILYIDDFYRFLDRREEGELVLQRCVLCLSVYCVYIISFFFLMGYRMRTSQQLNEARATYDGNAFKR